MTLAAFKPLTRVERKPKPAGFAAHGTGSGLIVPEALARQRVVLTKDQTKAMNTCLLKVLGPQRIKWALFCDNPGCPEPRIDHVREPGGFVLRCGCSDRVMETAF